MSQKQKNKSKKIKANKEVTNNGHVSKKRDEKK